jgi:hypothetical protein
VEGDARRAANWGNPRSSQSVFDVYNVYDAMKCTPVEQPRTATTYVLRGEVDVFSSPIMTGASVVAIKYKDGIMMAADTLCTLSFERGV